MASQTDIRSRNVKGASGIGRRIECDHDHFSERLLLAKRRRTRERKIITKPMRFVSLHHHSTYSSLDGFQMPEAHVRRAAELNMSALAMTEHGNVSSHDKLEVACDQIGVKPIYGCELYTGRVGENATQRKYHLTVIAKNDEGYQNLLRLVSRAWAEGFYYEPTVSWEMLLEHRRGLVILSGCQGSLLFCSAVGGKLIAEERASYRRAHKVAKAFKRAFGRNYFIEVQAFPELDKTRAFNPMAERLSRDLGIGLVATMDCHYTVPEEKEIQKVLHNVRGAGKQTLEEQVRSWGYTEELCPPPTDMSLYRRLRGTGLGKEASQEAIINTELINQEIEHIRLPQLPMLKYPCDDSAKLFRQWITEGWHYRGCSRMSAEDRDGYKERLKYEVGIIESKNFSDYFLVVSDAVRAAKDHGIPVGPARGSAAASLVCWLLRITEVNPMEFPSLMFERFIDLNRQDLPDIDLDFASGGRPWVRDYLVAKYGQECVNNIGTFNMYKSKNSLDDVARVYKIPSWDLETVKSLLIERSSGDLRADATIEDTVGQFEEAKDVFDRHPELYTAMDLEGNVRGIGVHSGGLVISNGPVTEVCAVYRRKVKGVMTEVISIDKYDCERRNLIKMDFLGLSTMEMISDGLRQLDMTVEDLYGLPLDDPQVIDGFRQADVVGIFQFDGRAMRQVNASLKPDSFKEICDVNALSRPGPLHNGAANEYIDIKRGVKQAERIHPVLDEITKDTYHQIVYQEQILKIVREIGDFDWTHAAYIRKIISKKLGEAEFNRQWDRFWEGAQRKHPDMSRQDAEQIWGHLITAGAYAFNLAHCVSYGMLAYWTMWLKVYHPTVFFASSLAKMPPNKHKELMRDAYKHGVEIRPPHPQLSALSWEAKKDAVQAGLGQLPSVGEKRALAMDEFRQSNEVSSWKDFAAMKGVGAKSIEKWEEFSNHPDPFDVRRIDRAIEEAKKLIRKMKGELPMPTHNGLQIPYERGDDQEIVWIGEVQARNLRDIFESNRARTGKELDPSEVQDSHLNEFMLMLGYDGHDLVSLRFNRFKYPSFRDAIWGIKLEHDLVLIRGVKPGWRTAREIYVDEMWVIEP